MDDKRSFLFGAAVAAAAFAGASYFMRGRGLMMLEDPSVIPIVTPMIDLYWAEYVLGRMGRVPGDELTLVLHTAGGCAASCVMISDAVRHFRRSRTIVPYMALSGGTLIALSAQELSMGRLAALSAVDPVIFGQRARHIEKGDEAGLHASAQEYDQAIRRQLHGILRSRLPAADLERAMAVFMGLDAPHEWPVYTPQLVELGLEVKAADPRWATYVDARRDAWSR